MSSPDTYSGVVFTFINTSSLRKVRNDLVERTMRMETLLRVTDAYVLINEKGLIQEVNEALIELVGYEEDALLGKNVSMLMPNDVAGEHDRYIDEYLDDGKSNIVGSSREITVRHKDGSLNSHVLSVAEMIIGQRHWFVGLLKSPN